MNRLAHGAVAVTVLLLATGCVTRERLTQSFREERDRCVGEIFMDRATWWCDWSHAISRRQVSATTEEYEIARDDMGKCRWIYTVDRESGRVTGWRYRKGSEDCYDRINYLGPW